MKKIKKSDTSQADDIFTSPTIIKHILKEHSISLKKKLGQHLLFDVNIIRKIIDSMNLKKYDKVIEIGPGIGNITNFYINKVNYAYLIEIDRGLVKVIKTLLKSDNMEIIHRDVLKTNFKDIVKKGEYILFSNLPYSIASQIIVKLVDNLDMFKEIYIMVPEILYKRITMINKKYISRIGILCESFFRIERLFKISRNSFFPVPAVDSVFLKLTPKKSIEVEYKDINVFKNFLQIIFKHRRKKISNSENEIISYFKIDKEELHKILNELEIDNSIRVDDISVKKILNLYKKLVYFYYKYAENKK